MTATRSVGLSPEAAVVPAPSARALDHAQPASVPGPLRRAAMVGGDFLGVVGVALSIPFVILAIGVPIALGLRVLLWIAGLF